jgi:hypothetical protein
VLHPLSSVVRFLSSIFVIDHRNSLISVKHHVKQPQPERKSPVLFHPHTPIEVLGCPSIIFSPFRSSIRSWSQSQPIQKSKASSMLKVPKTSFSLIFKVGGFKLQDEFRSLDPAQYPKLNVPSFVQVQKKLQ